MNVYAPRSSASSVERSVTTGRTMKIGRASCRERVERAVAAESSRRRHTRFDCDWSSDVCSSDLTHTAPLAPVIRGPNVSDFYAEQRFDCVLDFNLVRRLVDDERVCATIIRQLGRTLGHDRANDEDRKSVV